MASTPAHHRHLLLDTAGSSSEASSRQGGQGRARGEYTHNHEASFDSNMVIILAALLCALICALGLNSIVRCALRCSRRLAFEAPDRETTTAGASTGIGRSALRKIPIVIYGAPSALRVVASSECAICLGELAEGDKVRVLPSCCHGFHVACIDIWLLSHSSCPTCRHSLLDNLAKAEADHHHHHHIPPDASTLAVPAGELA